MPFIFSSTSTVRACQTQNCPKKGQTKPWTWNFWMFSWMLFSHEDSHRTGKGGLRVLFPVVQKARPALRTTISMSPTGEAKVGGRGERRRRRTDNQASGTCGVLMSLIHDPHNNLMVGNTCVLAFYGKEVRLGEGDSLSLLSKSWWSLS